MENILLKKKEYKVLEKLDGNSKFSKYLVELKDKKFVLYKYELESDLVLDTKKFKFIKRAIYYSPKLLISSKKDKILLREYIDGVSALELLSKENLDDEIYKQVYEIYRFCRVGKFELNYLPENFVFHNKHLYYVGDEKGPQDKDKNFENYGLYYWVYTPSLAKHLEEKGFPVDRNRILTKGEYNKKIVLLSIMNW